MKEPPADPFEQTYPESVVRFFPFRICVGIVACLLIILGRDTLPFDEVPCLQDTFIDLFSSATAYLNSKQWLGVTFLTISNLMVDLQLLAISVYWFLKIESFRLPYNVSVLALLKMLMVGLYQNQLINQTFSHSSPVPSILNGEPFRHDYFFNAQCGFMLLAGLQWLTIEKRIVGWITIGCLVWVSVVTLILRMNYFMDVFTGIFLAHLIFRLSSHIEAKINNVLLAPYRLICKKMEQQQQKPNS